MIRTPGLARPGEGTRGLSEYRYRQNTKQRADEELSHGRSNTDEKVKPLDGRLLERR